MAAMHHGLIDYEQSVPRTGSATSLALAAGRRCLVAPELAAVGR